LPVTGSFLTGFNAAAKLFFPGVFPLIASAVLTDAYDHPVRFFNEYNKLIIMKRNLLLVLSAGLLITLASSCRKYVEAPYVQPLTGRWYLQSAERYDSYKWQTLSTGYESGTFIFKANGDVAYTDALGSLYGNWSMYPETDGYYDGYGHYQQGYHAVFSLLLYEPGNNNPAANWVFDDNDYNGGSSFKAVYTSGNYTYEYNFVRE